MEGGVTVILTLMIVFAMIVGGVALFGAGGYVQRRRLKQMGEKDQPRPTHTAVDNETRDVEYPRDPATSPQHNE